MNLKENLTFKNILLIILAIIFISICIILCYIYLNGIIKWLHNSNNSMAFFTAMMALATVGVIIQNYMDKKEANKPRVVVYIKSINIVLYLVVKNIGLTNSYNIKLSSTKPLKNSRGDSFNHLFDNIIPFLPPNHEYTSFFDFGKGYFEAYPTKAPSYNINAEFEDINRNNYKSENPIDLNYFRGLTVFLGDGSEQVVDGLHKVDNELEKIYKIMKSESTCRNEANGDIKK